MIRFASFASSRVQLWITPCVVTMPPPDSAILVVPSNERLVGTQFSHFPVGGPTPVAEEIGESSIPPDAQESSWMLYQCETIDGVVTELQGTTQADINEFAPVINNDPAYPVRLRPGEAVNVPASGALEPVFTDGLILTVAPFWPGSVTATWHGALHSSYTRSLNLGSASSLALPLLGAGARGAPPYHASSVAAESVTTYLTNSTTTNQINFAVQDDDIAEILDEALTLKLE